jgi:hypothetical protein
MVAGLFGEGVADDRREAGFIIVAYLPVSGFGVCG